MLLIRKSIFVNKLNRSMNLLTRHILIVLFECVTLEAFDSITNPIQFQLCELIFFLDALASLDLKLSLSQSLMFFVFAVNQVM